MRPPHVGWLVVGALFALAGWSFAAGVRAGDAAQLHGFRLGTAQVASLHTTDGSGICERAEVPRK